jgi:hypothetical protein
MKIRMLKLMIVEGQPVRPGAIIEVSPESGAGLLRRNAAEVVADEPEGLKVPTGPQGDPGEPGVPEAPKRRRKKAE